MVFILLMLTMASMGCWFYLLYEILIAVSATELMWFIYYAYIPVSIALMVATQIAKDRN